MTRDEILAMDVHELKLAVAEHIFKAQVITKQNDPDSFLLVGYMPEVRPLDGSKWQFAKWSNSEEKAWLDCPNFGEDISAAWEVVEKITKKSEEDGGGPIVEVTHDGDWHAKFGKFYARARTAPEAICKAVLQWAVME